jgi:hypothetical protein
MLWIGNDQPNDWTGQVGIGASFWIAHLIRPATRVLAIIGAHLQPQRGKERGHLRHSVAYRQLRDPNSSRVQRAQTMASKKVHKRCSAAAHDRQSPDKLVYNGPYLKCTGGEPATQKAEATLCNEAAQQ